MWYIWVLLDLYLSWDFSYCLREQDAKFPPDCWENKLSHSNRVLVSQLKDFTQLKSFQYRDCQHIYRQWLMIRCCSHRWTRWKWVIKFISLKSICMEWLDFATFEENWQISWSSVVSCPAPAALLYVRSYIINVHGLHLVNYVDFCLLN